MARSQGPAVGVEGAPAQGVSAEQALEGIRAWLTDEVGRLEREASEIDMLVAQTRMEAERHDARRAKVEEQVKDLERRPDLDEREMLKAREQLFAINQRATLMEAQKQVLEGKQKTIQRYRDRMDALAAELGEAIGVGAAHGTATSSAPTARTATGERAAGRSASGGSAAEGPGVETPRAVMRAQEDLRRDIARQMHDGPAQSLANIALQAEIVQRLLTQDPARAAEEVEQLRATVQHALDTTKTFIFDVRPMVLDDLGLVPTLRRAAADRGRRAGVRVDFDSLGADQRLTPDLESSFFRILDDALAGYLGLGPSAISLHLDWNAHELRATVRSGRAEERAAGVRAAAEAKKADPADLPPALAAMIEAQRADEREAWTHARALPPERWREIQGRAEAVGVAVELLDDGQTLEAVARWE